MFSEYPEALIGKRLDFKQAMYNVFHMANVSAGTHASCLSANAHSPETCIFVESVFPHIKTPLFALQPRFGEPLLTVL